MGNARYLKCLMPKCIFFEENVMRILSFVVDGGIFVPLFILLSSLSHSEQVINFIGLLINKTEIRLANISIHKTNPVIMGWANVRRWAKSLFNGLLHKTIAICSWTLLFIVVVQSEEKNIFSNNVTCMKVKSRMLTMRERPIRTISMKTFSN